MGSHEGAGVREEQAAQEVVLTCLELLSVAAGRVYMDPWNPRTHLLLHQTRYLETHAH